MRNITAAVFFATALAACSVHELAATFGDAVQVSVEGDVTTVEYCPDNTCEEFALPVPSAAIPLQDFAFAYLLGVSEYFYLDSFRSDIASLATQSVLGRYRTHCPQPDNQAAARCIVGHLASKYPIQASFVRYDEGERNEVPISLEEFRDDT